VLTTVERVLLLSQMRVFAQTRTEDLAHVAAICRESRVTRGETLYSSGEPARDVHVVVSGRLRLESSTLGTHEAGVGVAFGALSLFDEAPRAFTVTALVDTHLLAVERDAFLDVLADHVNITEGVLRAVSSRLRRALGHREARDLGDDVFLL
jgi:CRP-like cAMP-binding protein